MEEPEIQTNEDALVKLAGDIDISPTDYKRAQSAINGVTECLENGHPDKYPGSEAVPQVYLQGSMRYGTVVKPVDEDEGYDVDLVCELDEDWTQDGHTGVKEQVGTVLSEHGTYGLMLDKEGARCWTLNYKGESGLRLHVDVLPCVHERQETIAAIAQDLLANGGQPSLAVHSVAITNRDRKSLSYSWKPGNALGYAEWFEGRNAHAFALVAYKQKQMLLEAHAELYEAADRVPDALVRTPLQRAIQILKRHRDVRFVGCDNSTCRPISMIITTLAAKIYAGENDVESTLRKIIGRLSRHQVLLERKSPLLDGLGEEDIEIHRRDGKWWIPNPVNRGENFADRWHENDDARAKAFFDWIRMLERDLLALLDGGLTGNELYRRMRDPLVRYKSFPLMVPAAPKRAEPAPVIDHRQGPRPWRR